MVRVLLCSGFRVKGACGLQALVYRFRVQGLRFKGLGFRVQGLGIKA